MIAVYAVAVLGISRLVGRLSGSLHPALLIGAGGVAACARCFLIAISRTPSAAIAGSALLGVAWASMHSSLQTWATEVLPAARATVVSAFAGALILGNACAALLAGGPAEDGLFTKVFAVAAVLAVPLGLAAGLGRLFWKRPEGEPGR